MTVSTQVSRNEYTGNGVTTQYDFTFRILDKGHLLVQTLDAAENITTLTLGSDYSVTGVNRYPGGKVVLTTALPAGYKISIERKTPVTQETSIRNQGGFFPEIHEDAFDKLTMLVQQVYGWWSGLALKKPSWLANYYDAQNNRIRNLRDPSQAQDAATKNYVDVEVAAEAAERQATDNNLQSQISVNLQRTLRVPESYVDVLPSVAARRNSLFGWNNSGKPVPIFSMTETADLAIKLASSDEGLGGDLVADTEYFSVRNILSRIRTLADVGAPLPYLGYDPVNDSALYNAMGELPDRHLLLNGGLHLAGDCTNGIRRNAGLFSVRGGQEDSGQGFNVPLMGVSNARGLRGYGIYELVPFYSDVTTPERQEYHNVATATYTATTATIDPTTYAETLAKLKVGHYIRTMHSTYCIGLVTAINAATGVITVDEWADSGTTTTTPANGIGLYTRFITKAYAQNINLFITANSDVTNATGVELGMSSHKQVSGTVAGLDIPVLSSSTQNMTVGLLVRAATTNGTGLDFSV
ncbi:TPA: phage tail fiber protein, partial [Raoultella ornithinolytica]